MNLFRIAAVFFALLLPAQAQIGVPVPATVPQGALIAYTPTVVCGQSTGTAVCVGSARYQVIGKIVFLTIKVVVSGTFTVGTITSATLPFTAANQSQRYILVGRENGSVGQMWQGEITEGGTTLGYNNYVNSNTIAAGYQIQITGWYEAQ